MNTLYLVDDGAVADFRIQVDNVVNTLNFYAGGDFVVRLTADGGVEVNEKYETEEAARKFWECVRLIAPEFLDKTPSEFDRLCGKEPRHV